MFTLQKNMNEYVLHCLGMKIKMMVMQ